MRARLGRISVISTLLALVALALPGGAAAPARATVFVDPGPGGFTSANVTYVASIPTGAGVSARVVTVKGQRRLYVSSAHSLTIYDLTNPALPVPLGALAIDRPRQPSSFLTSSVALISATITASAGSHRLTVSGVPPPADVSPAVMISPASVPSHLARVLYARLTAAPGPPPAPR